jgi:hypothetical protein
MERIETRKIRFFFVPPRATARECNTLQRFATQKKDPDTHQPVSAAQARHVQ